MAKRLMCVVLSVLMIMAVLPTGVVGDEEVTYTDWSETASLPTTDGNYQLKNDVTITSKQTIESGQTVVLDLNGYTVTFDSTSSTCRYQVEGSLTIRDSSFTSSGYLKKTAGYTEIIQISGSGACILESGTIYCTSTNSTNQVRAIDIEGSGTFTMKGGTVEVVTTADSNHYSATIVVNISSKNTPTCNIEGGTVSYTGYAGYAITAGGGNINISGGSISTTCTSDDVRYSATLRILGGTTKISGGTIESTCEGCAIYSYSNVQYGTVTIDITDCNMSSAGDELLNITSDANGTVNLTISGGVYSADVSSYVVEGYTQKSDGEVVLSSSIVPVLYGKSLVIGTKIGVRYYYTLDDSLNASDYKVYFTVDNDTQTSDLTEMVVGDNTYYVATCYVSFYQMGQSITATVYKDGTPIDSTTNSGYSVRKYYVNKYSTAADTDTTKALLVAMLNYGSYGQTYIGNTNTLANDELNISDKISSVSASDLSGYVSTSETSEGYSGSYKVYGSVIISASDSVKLKFTFENVDDCTITINGIDVALDNDGSVTTEDIYVQSWDSFVTIKISGTSGDMTVKFCVLSYAYSMINAYETDSGNVTADNTENLRNLLKAMYLYNDAADIYLGNKTVSE